MNHLYIFITGASGAGKTTILKVLEALVGDNTSIATYYFDDIGVPSFENMIEVYGVPEKWQEMAVNQWVGKLAQISNKKTILLEGSFNPDFLLNALDKYNIKNYHLICLHADSTTRTQRLEGRNQCELIHDDMNNWAEFLKSKTLELGGVIIDTSNVAPNIIANDITNLINKAQKS